MSAILTLLALALVFFFLEIFVPGGILTIIGGLLILASAVIAYQEYGWLAALILFFVAVIGAFLMFFIEVKLLTKTPFGKRIQLTGRQEAASLTAIDVKPFIDQIGTTVTPLNPSGRIRINGQLLEAVSDIGWIAKGQPVKVTGSDVFHVRVRLSESDESTAS